jgi:hypothetical protein
LRVVAESYSLREDSVFGSGKRIIATSSWFAEEEKDRINKQRRITNTFMIGFFKPL